MGRAAAGRGGGEKVRVGRAGRRDGSDRGNHAALLLPNTRHKKKQQPPNKTLTVAGKRHYTRVLYEVLDG